MNLNDTVPKSVTVSDVNSLWSFLMLTSYSNQLELWSRLRPEATSKYRCVRPGMNSVFLTGSKAEFYIQPSLRYFDDTDVMNFHLEALAFVDDFPSMPWDIRGLDENIHCLEIRSLGEPAGYCLLRHKGILTFCWETQLYNFKPAIFSFNGNFSSDFYVLKREETYERHIYEETKYLNAVEIRYDEIGLSSIKGSDPEYRGPAFRLGFKFNEGNIDVLENIECLWCPQWPTEAAEWWSRPRKYGWPTKTMIQRIVENGCHFVKVCHPDCPDDKAEFQWRFSFSHAEIILIRSWTPVQQVVYHILRYIAKRELIKKNCQREEEILTGYHLKTIMLWRSEKNPMDWWTSAPGLVILSRVLQKLSKWLRRKQIPNYFLPHANLLPRNLHAENFRSSLQKIDYFSNVINLYHWFLRYYVSEYCQKTFITVSSMRVQDSEIGNIATKIEKMTHLENIPILCIHLEGNNNNFLNDCLFFKMAGIAWNGKNPTGKKNALKFQLKQRTANNLLSRIGIVSHQASLLFLPYNSALILLFVEYLVSTDGMTYDRELVADMIRGIPMETKPLCVKSHNFPQKPSYRDKLQQSHVLLLRAQEVLETLVAPRRDAEFHVLSQVTLSILKQCLLTQDSESVFVWSAAVLYIAAVCYVDLEYQTTVELCSLVMCDEVVRIGSKTLNAFCLLFIDDVARIAGILLLFRKLQNPYWSRNKPLHLLLSITPSVFAEYLLAVAGNVSNYCFKNAGPLSILNFHVMDVLLILLTNRRHQSNVLRHGKHHSCIERRSVYFRTDFIRANKIMKAIKPRMNVKTTTNMLFEWCLKNMETFARELLQRYGIIYSAIDCYRALYLAETDRWLEVKEMCCKMSPLVETDFIITDDTLDDLSLEGAVVLPLFNGFYDKDIQSLLGFQMLCLFNLPLGPREFRFSDFDLRTRQHAARFIQNGVSPTALENQYFKLLFILRRGFVAQYLLLKSAIALREPRSRVYSLFHRFNSALPFEILIHTFLYQQFRRKGWKELNSKIIPTKKAFVILSHPLHF